MIKNNTWTANVLTLFPEMFPGSLSYSLTGKSLKNKRNKILQRIN